MPRLLRPDEVVDLKLSRFTNKDRKVSGKTFSDIDKLVEEKGFMPDLSGALTEEQLITADKGRQIMGGVGEMISEHLDSLKSYRPFKRYEYLPGNRELYVGAVKIIISNSATNTHRLLSALNKRSNRTTKMGYAKFLNVNKKKYFTIYTQKRAIISARKYIKHKLSEQGIDDFFSESSGLVVNEKYR